MQADRGDIPAAETTLRGLLATAPIGHLRVRALILLGDLLSAHEDQEAPTVLAEALMAAGQVEDADHLLDVELDRAREVLAR